MYEINTHLQNKSSISAQYGDGRLLGFIGLRFAFVRPAARKKVSQGEDFDVRIKEDKGIPVWLFSSLTVNLCVIYLFRQMQSVR